jgi:YD repeat-containing protein
MALFRHRFLYPESTGSPPCRTPPPRKIICSSSSRESGRRNKLQSTFTFAYDGQDRLVERHWNSKVSRFTYNSAGDLASANLGDGADTAYTYDDCRKPHPNREPADLHLRRCRPCADGGLPQ